MAKTSIITLVIAGLLLTSTGAYATLQFGGALEAWDSLANPPGFTSGNAATPFNGGCQSWYYEVRWNDTSQTEHLFTGSYELGYCPGGQPTTYYADRLLVSHHHEDSSGGWGYQDVRNFKLVSCDFDGDGDFDNGDLTVDPFDASGNLVGTVTEYRTSSDLKIVNPSSGPPYSYERACGPGDGSCAFVIETELFMNLDSDCDRSLADETPALPANLCLVWQAEKPDVADEGFVPWDSPNLQSRLVNDGGDKTVSTRPAGPTFVTLTGPSARAAAPLLVAIGFTAAGLLLAGGVGVVFFRRRRR
jgi:LPXTG-motif cell wall-anchored protein